MTSYERLRKGSCRAIVIPIGETVWYKELGDGNDRKNKAATEWFKGVCLGPSLQSSETLVGTEKGVVRAYSVDRLSPSVRWDINRILDMKGTPQRPDLSKPGLNIPAKIRLEPEVAIDMPVMRPARKEEGPRAAYLSKEDFRNFGFTEVCDGCGRLAAGMMMRDADNGDHCPEIKNENVCVMVWSSSLLTTDADQEQARS